MGHFPEHCLAGYTDAWLLGVDYVELDLQMTKDGVLVANHDECMKDSTDAELYDSLWKSREQTICWHPADHCCTRDYLFPEFTLGEVRMVKRRQRFSYRSTALDGLWSIPTFEEVIKHMQFLSATYDRSRVGAETLPGLYIELKQPQWYLETYNMDIAQAIFDVLQKYGLSDIAGATEQGIPIIIQSFNEDALRRFAELSDLPLVQLMYWQHEGAEYDFDNLATYAHGVGPDSKYVMYWPSEEPVEIDPTTKSAFIDEMHARDLTVHPWTLRNDNLQYMSTPAEETTLYANKGVDGIFTEFVQTTYSVFDKVFPNSA